MKTPLRFSAILVIAAAVTLGAGCGDSGDARRAASAPASTAPSANKTAPSADKAASEVQTPPPIAPQTTQEQAAGQTAQAGDDALRPMTKEDEATSMPRPGQANDHSTLSPPKDGNR